MKTDELIIQLARSAAPVRVLPRPSVRLAQWMAVAAPIAVFGAFLVGPRADIASAVRQPVFIWTAVVTAVTAVLSAASAFVLSVPGAERTPIQRGVPLAAAAVWALILMSLLLNGENAFARVVALPIHAACLIEIAAFGLLPGWLLFSMLRRAAPLQLSWSAALATLAAAALGAVATQFVCPLDDPAHLLVSHAVPVIALASWGAVARRNSLRW